MFVRGERGRLGARRGLGQGGRSVIDVSSCGRGRAQAMAEAGRGGGWAGGGGYGRRCGRGRAGVGVGAGAGHVQDRPYARPTADVDGAKRVWTRAQDVYETDRTQGRPQKRLAVDISHGQGRPWTLATGRGG